MSRACIIHEPLMNEYVLIPPRVGGGVGGGVRGGLGVLLQDHPLNLTVGAAGRVTVRTRPAPNGWML